jgi:hypothetical protein
MRDDRTEGIFHQALHSEGMRLNPTTLRRMESIRWLPVTSVCGTVANQPGDRWEQEAERQAAEAVKCAGAGPLSAVVRETFARVVVHAGEQAGRAARRLGARAFTWGNHIVFAPGQYQPQTSEGLRLLVHELTHVLQQQRAGECVLQRSEVDSAALTPAEIAALGDSWMDINTYVNDAIDKGRKAAKDPKDAETILKTVFEEIGVNPFGNVGESTIEVWANKLPPTKAIPPDKSKTKYQDTTFFLWKWPRPPLCPVLKVNNILIGTDKLGHFMQQGYQCFREKFDEHSLYKFDAAVKGLKAVRGNSPLPEDFSARAYGWAMETGGFGLLTTGVYSKGDQAANLSGRQFYKDLAADPANYKFDIRNYVNPLWNEESNPSLYAAEVGKTVWDVLLRGRNKTVQLTWQGQFTTSPLGNGKWLPITAQLQVQGFTVKGTFNFKTGTNWGDPTKTGKPQTLTVTKGSITYLTDPDEGVTAVRNLPPGSRPTYGLTSKDPVYKNPVITGVRVDYDWAWGEGTGKGYFGSVDEQHLEGRFGNDLSDDNAGIITLSADGTPGPRVRKTHAKVDPNAKDWATLQREFAEAAKIGKQVRGER